MSDTRLGAAPSDKSGEKRTSAQRSTRSDWGEPEESPPSTGGGYNGKLYLKHGVLTRHAAAASAYRVGNANPQARRAAPISTSRRRTADPRRFAPGCSHRRLPRPMEPEQLSIGITATGQPVHFSREERERHVYVVGKSGSGKSTLLFNLAMLDIMAGKGVAIKARHRRSRPVQRAWRQQPNAVPACVPCRTAAGGWKETCFQDQPILVTLVADARPNRDKIHGSYIHDHCGVVTTSWG
jgi:hypothetical protein